jgi:hypothetical protein
MTGSEFFNTIGQLQTNFAEAPSGEAHQKISAEVMR